MGALAPTLHECVGCPQANDSRTPTLVRSVPESFNLRILGLVDPCVIIGLLGVVFYDNQTGRSRRLDYNSHT